MKYAWLVWTLILLAVWLVVYLSLRDRESKKEMMTVSLWTTLLGLTEPIFVPEYWMPPSLFNLAEKTGFDIESFIFSFGIGGLAVVLYERFFSKKHLVMPQTERRTIRHRVLHPIAILSVPLTLAILLFFTNFNPIYSSIVALVIGGILTIFCRPDLVGKMFASGFIFLIFYFFFFLTLIELYPGYVEKVWNLAALSEVLILGIPLEELLFAASFGFFWSSVYEKFTWQKMKPF